MAATSGPRECGRQARRRTAAPHHRRGFLIEQAQRAQPRDDLGRRAAAETKPPRRVSTGEAGLRRTSPNTPSAPDQRASRALAPKSTSFYPRLSRIYSVTTDMVQEQQCTPPPTPPAPSHPSRRALRHGRQHSWTPTQPWTAHGSPGREVWRRPRAATGHRPGPPSRGHHRQILVGQDAEAITAAAARQLALPIRRPVGRGRRRGADDLLRILDETGSRGPWSPAQTYRWPNCAWQQPESPHQSS